MKKVFQASLALTRGPIARSSIKSMSIRVAGLAVSLLQAVLGARLLGAVGYGTASVALSAAQIAATIAAFGFGPLAVREIARYRATGDSAAIADFTQGGARMTASLALLAAGLFATAAFAGLIPIEYRSALMWSGLVILPMTLLQLQRGIAQGLGRIAPAQVPGELLRPGLFVSFLLWATAMRMPLGPDHYLIAFALAAFAALVFSMPITLRGMHEARSGAGDPVRRRNWRTEARPFLGITLVGMLLAEINTLLLGWLAAPQEAGLFQPVARVTPLMVLPAQVVAIAFAPRVADLWEQGKRAQVVRLAHLFTVVTSAMTLTVVVLLILSAPLLMRAFGSEFLPSAALLWIAGIAQVFNAAAGPVGHLLSMTGHARTALSGQLGALAANFVLGILLIPPLGARGATMAMAAGLIVWNLLLVIRVRQKLGFDPSVLSAIPGTVTAR